MTAWAPRRLTMTRAMRLTVRGRRAKAASGMAITAGGCVIVATLTARAMQQAATSAPAPRPIVPLAAGSFADDPAAHYGEYVSLMGAVEQQFSRSVFSVDQDPARRSEKD